MASLRGPTSPSRVPCSVFLPIKFACVGHHRNVSVYGTLGAGQSAVLPSCLAAGLFCAHSNRLTNCQSVHDSSCSVSPWPENLVVLKESCLASGLREVGLVKLACVPQSAPLFPWDLVNASLQVGPCPSVQTFPCPPCSIDGGPAYTIWWILDVTRTGIQVPGGPEEP